MSDPSSRTKRSLKTEGKLLDWFYLLYEMANLKIHAHFFERYLQDKNEVPPKNVIYKSFLLTIKSRLPSNVQYQCNSWFSSYRVKTFESQFVSATLCMIVLCLMRVTTIWAYGWVICIRKCNFLKFILARLETSKRTCHVHFQTKMSGKWLANRKK